ncbi:MAG: hypothetical protein AAFO78_09380 [Pseudomonadota bacterium]
MRISRPRRIRKPVGIYLTSAALLCPIGVTANAQDSGIAVTVEEALVACSAINNRASRLECFDSLSAAVKSTTTVSQTGSAPPSATTRRGATVAAKPAPPAPAEGDEKRLKVEPTSEQQTAAPQQEATPPAKTADAGDTPAASEKKFLIIPKNDPTAKRLLRTPFTSKILKAWLRRDKIYVALDNGEVWKQTSINRPRMPKEGQDAAFTKGGVGWFVQFNGRGPKISVTQVK